MDARKRKEKLNALSKKLGKRKYISILLALFTLGVNIFAWFVFTANVGFELDATVASWDVQFKDNEEIISRYVLVEVSKMKPGMSTFNKSIEVETMSDVEAVFSYEVVSLSILGRQIDLSGQANQFDYLSDFYPFSITASASRYTLTQEDSITFEVNVTWPFEDGAVKTYFGQDAAYVYEPEFSYYTKNNNIYTATTVTSAQYPALKNSLYLEKDDADTFFGMQCGDYESTTGEACLVLNLKLLVQQSQ